MAGGWCVVGEGESGWDGVVVGDPSPNVTYSLFFLYSSPLLVGFRSQFHDFGEIGMEFH